MPTLNGRVAKYLTAGNHLESDAAKALTDLHTPIARALTLAAHCVAKCWKWWLHTIRFSAMRMMVARSERLQCRTSGPLLWSTWSLW